MGLALLAYLWANRFQVVVNSRFGEVVLVDKLTGEGIDIQVKGK